MLGPLGFVRLVFSTQKKCPRIGIWPEFLGLDFYTPRCHVSWSTEQAESQLYMFLGRKPACLDFQRLSTF